MYFVNGENLQKSSADCFKLTNEILIMSGKHHIL